jgi:hypothetical protein
VDATPDQREATEAGMRKLDDELRTLKNFRGVAYFFDNWMREATGGWRRIGQKKIEPTKPERCR